MTTSRAAGAGGGWRYPAGLALLALAFGLILASLLLPLVVPEGQAVVLAGFLVAGPPEILCLVAVSILGEEHFNRIVPRAGQRAASRLRYYAGLTGCLMNAVPLILYAYVPGILPGGSSRLFILTINDLVFIVCLFLAGGEFWRKTRSLLVWQGSC